MSRKSENTTTSQSSKGPKSIPEMSWEEIFALPTKNVSNREILEFRKREAAKRNK